MSRCSIDSTPRGRADGAGLAAEARRQVALLLEVPASSRSDLERVEVSWPQFVADSGDVSMHKMACICQQGAKGGACGGLLFLLMTGGRRPKTRRLLERFL